MKKLNNEIKKIEESIANAELSKKEIEELLSLEENYSDVNKLNDLNKKYESVKNELTDLQNKWEGIAEQLMQLEE